jgi:hypothetical protein
LGVSGTGTCVFTAAGNSGGTGINQDGGLYYGQPGWGAGSQFTCSPTPNPSGSVIPTTGIAAPANTGAGGSGAGGLNAVSFAASGGGSGGYAELLYQNLSFTSATFFTYAIGAGGTPVVPTVYYGGAGGSGCIIVMGFY